MSIQIPPLAERLRRGRLERITFLSDGVYAIAITLAALELAPPHNAMTLGAVLAGIAPSLMAYALSFLIIGTFWWSNRALLTRLEAIDPPLTILVLLTLCAVATIPAATRGLYDDASGPGQRSFYALVMVVAGALNWALWLYVALRPKLRHDDVTARYAWTRVGTTATVPLIFAAFLIADRWSTWAAPTGILLVIAIRRTFAKLGGGERR